MDKVIYQSFYGDEGLSSLKHSVLYFDKVMIPDVAVAVSLGNDGEQHSAYFSFIPREMRSHLEFLQSYGAVEIGERNDVSFDNLDSYYSSIQNGFIEKGVVREYSDKDIADVASIIDINRSAKNYYSSVDEAAIFSASISMMEAVKNKTIVCTDNPLVHDSVESGLRYCFSQLEDSVAKELKRYATTLLTQKVLSLNLPSFKFQSFEDVLELKEIHKDELSALYHYLYNYSDKIELSPFDPSYNDRLTELVSKHIQPSIDDFRNSTKHSVSRIVKNSADVGAGALIAFGVTNDLPSHAASFMIGALGLTCAKVIIEECFNVDKKHPFNVLLKLKNY